MTYNLQNIEEAKEKLNRCSVSTYSNAGDSFKTFITKLDITCFRHLNNFSITFEHPITVISGTNKAGKTSILLLLACSHEKFLKIDSTSPSPSLRPHAWSDVLTFTTHEQVNNDYSYNLSWRVGVEDRFGTGKRLASSQAWSGLGKKSSDRTRINAKIRDRVVRLLDLERVLPGRSFSNALFRKSDSAPLTRLNSKIEQAFAYIFNLNNVEIFESGQHINKSCFVISKDGQNYSTFNSASGEESVIYLLRDLIDSPKDSLILIDEIEAGFHPSVQRKLADIVQYVSWVDKKQFVITTHSPTLLSAFHNKSRRFIELVTGGHKVWTGISHQAARSKMDSVGYPLVRLYCEDELASFMIKKILVRMSRENQYFERLINLVESGPINDVKTDYLRHKHNFKQLCNRIGYSAIFDGDYQSDPSYNQLLVGAENFTTFIYPHDKPEKFLIKAYLNINNDSRLSAHLVHENHHSLFDRMVHLGLASDKSDARNQCYQAFEISPEFERHEIDIKNLLSRTVDYFSLLQD